MFSLFQYAIDAPFDLFILVMDRLAFCPVDEVELVVDLFIEVVLALL